MHWRPCRATMMSAEVMVPAERATVTPRHQEGSHGRGLAGARRGTLQLLAIEHLALDFFPRLVAYTGWRRGGLRSMVS